MNAGHTLNETPVATLGMLMDEASHLVASFGHLSEIHEEGDLHGAARLGTLTAVPKPTVAALRELERGFLVDHVQLVQALEERCFARYLFGRLRKPLRAACRRPRCGPAFALGKTLLNEGSTPIDGSPRVVKQDLPNQQGEAHDRGNKWSTKTLHLLQSSVTVTPGWCIFREKKSRFTNSFRFRVSTDFRHEPTMKIIDWL
jgi:hypothetical protein